VNEGKISPGSVIGITWPIPVLGDSEVRNRSGLGDKRVPSAKSLSSQGGRSRVHSDIVRDGKIRNLEAIGTRSS